MKTYMLVLATCISIIIGFGSLIVVQGRGQPSGNIWSRTFSVDIAHGETVVALVAAEQDRTHLIGEFLFENNTNREGRDRTVIIQGRRDEKGEFWPKVELRVGNDLKGSWKTV